MRGNFIGGASITGGSGTLTITAAGGLALPAAAFVDGQTVEYSIVEYTDATLATVSKAESGFGRVSSSNVLTRTRPVTTMSGGVVVQTSFPTKISFASANVRVYMTAVAEGGSSSYPARANFEALTGYGVNAFMMPSNHFGQYDLASVTLEANTMYMIPTKIDSGFQITSLGVQVVTAATGKKVSACIASIDPDLGTPGTVLAVANDLSTSSTVVVTASQAGRLIAPGWYYSCFLSDGTPSLAASEQVLPNFMGVFLSRTCRQTTRSKTYAPFVVGTNAIDGTTGSAQSGANAPVPLIFWK